jgi:hypothetical protein
VSSIDISPYPPKKGDTIAVSFEGVLAEGFSAATWAASVKWGIITKKCAYPIATFTPNPHCLFCQLCRTIPLTFALLFPAFQLQR